MYQPTTDSMAMALMFLTMGCWGSWANTQKLAPNWRMELFYCDYIWGLLFASILLGVTLGAVDTSPVAFWQEWHHASTEAKVTAVLAGIIFNVGNFLLIAAIVFVGMGVAFPIALGIAVSLGTVLNYWMVPKGNPTLLGLGVLAIIIAIAFDAKAYQKLPGAKISAHAKKGFIMALISGVLLASFYPLLVQAMSVPQALGPYTVVTWFAIGAALCHMLVHRVLLRVPLQAPIFQAGTYMRGTLRQHMAGILGGLLWTMGMVFNLIAANRAGPAVAFALGQGATLVATIWGVFVWREFKGAEVKGLLTCMFASYILGLTLIGIAQQF